MKEIPLRDKNGNVTALTLVDDEDYETLNRWRWYLQKNGYVVRKAYDNTKKSKLKTVYMHRQIMNADMGEELDHIDCNKLNNQKTNLRLATRKTNAFNRGKKADNKSGYKGVYLEKRTGKYYAQIKYEDKITHLGTYETKESAAAAYNEAAKQYHGEYANINEVQS